MLFWGFFLVLFVYNNYNKKILKCYFRYIYKEKNDFW